MADSQETRRSKAKLYAAEVFAELPVPGEAAAFATAASTRQKRVSTLAAGAGSRLVREAVLRDLAEQFKAVGVYTHRPLTSPGLSRTDWVRLARVPFAPEDLFFENETLLKEYLQAGIGKFGPFRDLDLEGTEFLLPSKRRIDILCRERRRDGRGALVAIELKRAENSAGVVTQLVRYLEELAGHPVAAGREVRGIIVSGRADEIETRMLKSETRFTIEWYCYSVEFTKAATSAAGEK